MFQITSRTERFRLAEVFTISRGSRTEAQVLTVAAAADGITGRGECVPYARYGETLDSVAARIAALPAGIDRASLQAALPPGAARNAVDCALWDWQARQSGRRVWQLAGLAAPVPVQTCYTLSLDTPERMQAAAARNAHRPILKIKLGTESDMPRLEAVRAGAPRARIVVDAYEGWSAEVYTDVAPHLIRLGVQMVEQPLPAGRDQMLAEIARPLPVCADESCHDRASLPDLIGKYDMVNIKLDQTGGLTGALDLLAEARRRGFGVMVGCMVSSSLSIAPAFHVARHADFVDLDGPIWLANDHPGGARQAGAELHPPRGLWGDPQTAAQTLA